MTDLALSFTSVTRKYGDVVALRNLSMEVERGEMFGLIGPDGAGKTTAIRLMCGLLKPDGGKVVVMGCDPVADHLRVTQSIGYLSQRFSLYGDLTIDENIAFFAEIHGLNMTDPKIRDRRQRLLELTQLTAFRGRLAEQLSGGMKQKLALACTLVHEPTLILLDEPTTGVDPVSRREFWKLLSEFLAQGITILMATPYLDEAERCHRVVLMHEGRALALDTPANLQASLAGTVIEIVVSPARKALDVVRSVAGADRAQLFGDRLHVRVDRREAVTPIVAQLRAAGLEPTHVRPIVPALEDVFIERVQRS